jgi:hypothetical protein
MADHELVANDTDPSWEGYLDYGDVPALVNDAPNPDLPALVGDETLTWIMRLTTSPNTVLESGLTVVDAATRHVRKVFTKAETGMYPDQDTTWECVVQIDYADGRRQTHPGPSHPKVSLLIGRDLGGPNA